MEFEKHLIKDIATVQTGPFGSQLHKKDYIENGIPIITVEHLGNNKILHQNMPGVKEVDVKRLSKYDLTENDIVFSRVGSVDRSALVSKEEEGWLFSGRCLRVRATSERVDPVFLSYYFQQYQFREYIRNVAVGATMPSINTKILANIEISLPSIDNQKKLGSFLHKIDQKIWLNENILNNLEQLAQTLFKRWFVDFEFPNANGDPYKSSGGEMMESESGMIPVLFGSQFLSNTVEFLSGGTPKTKNDEYWNGDIPFFTPKDSTGSIYETETEKSITQLGLSKCNSKLYPKNTIFITARGTVGKLSVANTDMAMNQSCFALKHKEDNQYFLYFMMETLLRQIIQGSNGAVFNAINLRDLNTLKVVYPTDQLVFQFEEIIKPIFEMLSTKEYENINLIKLRDTLLPKLLSGEIELPDENEVTEDVPIS